MSARNTPRKTVLKMTKGHFQFIAQVIHDLYTPSNDGFTEQDIREQFADALAKTNPRFDRETFIKACIGD